jgi:hypothetical protein
VTGGSGGSALVLIQSQIVTGANVQSITFSGLDGDSDRLYLLKGKLIKGGGANGTVYNYTLRPNNQTTNIAWQQFFPYRDSSGANGIAVSTDTTVYLGGSSYATADWNLVIHICAEKSVPRLFNIRSDRYTTNSTVVQYGLGRYSARWNETSTNLTSLVIYCDQAGGIGVGSDFHLYKIIV